MSFNDGSGAMKRLCLPIACGVILLGTVQAGAQDKSGAWTGVVTESASDCQNIVKARPGEYRLDFATEGR